jgi:hypothetical protein
MLVSKKSFQDFFLGSVEASREKRKYFAGLASNAFLGSKARIKQMGVVFS